MIAIALIVCVALICKTVIHVTHMVLEVKYPAYKEPEGIKDIDDSDQLVNFDDIIAEIYNREEDNNG